MGIKKWNEVIEIRSGRNQTEVECVKGEYPILGSAGKVMGYAKKYISDEGSILIGRKGTIDNPLFIPYKYWNVDTAFGIHSLESIDNRFLYYFCKNYDFKKEDKGSGRPSLVKTDLLKIEMPVPPLSEQQEIVSILDDAFESIERAKSNAEKNLRNAKELFDSYLQGVFENEGDGWEQKTLDEVCELINRGVSPKYLEENGVIVLNQKCIRDHKISFEQSRFHDGVSKKVNPEKMVKLGDVLINSTGTGTLGRVAQVREELKNVTVDSHVTIVRPIQNIFYLDFFGWALIFIEDEIAKRGEGCGGQTELARSTLKNDFSICFPKSLKEQQVIVKKLDALSVESKKLETIYNQKINDLEELKKSILQKAFSGELKTAKALV